MRLWRFVVSFFFHPAHLRYKGADIRIPLSFDAGDDMEDLFIVTASCKDKPELNEKYPQGGDLFKVRVNGIKGVERYKFGN